MRIPFIADSTDYSPTLLRGRLNWNRTLGERFQTGVYRIVFVREGVHTVTVGGDKTEVHAGNLYLVQPGQWEPVHATRGASAMLLAFTVMRCALKRDAGTAWDPIEPGHRQPSPKAIWGLDLPLVLDSGLATSLAGQVALISSIWWRSRWHHFRANNILSDLLERVVTHYREMHRTESPTEDPHASAGDRWIYKVYHLIDQRLATIQTTSDLAAAFNMGRDHFTRRFKSSTGQTPIVYLKQRRLNEAALLLRSTDWTLDLIANHVGYPSRGAFHQAWRRAHSVSPTEWRSG